MILTILASVLGIASTIIAWKLNPRQQIYRDIDGILKETEEAYNDRDKALAENNSDDLTAATLRLRELKDRRKTLLQRLG